MDLIQTLLLLAAVVCSTNAFSKYGRSCKDIGCLPSESCIIASDSCSWSQQDGKECGSYPTCKKKSSINNLPGQSSDGLPDNTVTRKPYVPPPSNAGGNIPPVNPNLSNGGGHLYPTIPNAPSAPSAPNDPNNGNYYPGFNPNRNPSAPNPYDPYRNPNGVRDPYGGQDPHANKNKGSSSDDDDDDSGSTLKNLFNFLRGGGGSGSNTRYGSGGSGSGGLSYGDIFNALNSGGNRGGSGGGGGLSDILSSFGNRGSGGGGYPSSSGGGSGLSDILFGRGGNNGFDDRRQQPPLQPQPKPSGGSGSQDGGFLSGLTSILGQRLADSLVRNALSGNRGNDNSGGNGGSGGGDIFNRLRYSGLFNENNGHSANNADNSNKPKVTVSGAGPGGYPTQPPAYPSQA